MDGARMGDPSFSTYHHQHTARSASMSGSGSISRKRVGSVSARSGEALPPLDIQSIQMPSNPYVLDSTRSVGTSLTRRQNALALKTAALSSTRSLFQTCSALRKRLRHVHDFQIFLGAEPLDVVSHMCHVLRLGSSLCHLYNLLLPSFVDPHSPIFAPGLDAPPQIQYDLPPFLDYPDGVRNWAKRPENAKSCQRYIAQFTMAMNKRKQEGRWHGEMWALHELWGKSTGEDAEGYDSTGLLKVLQTVEEMVDQLPESAIIAPESPSTPQTASVIYGSRHKSIPSFDVPFSMGGTASGSTAIANMAATMNGGVHIQAEETSEDMQRSQSAADANAFKSVEELVRSEQSYVQELEILVRYSTELVAKHLVSTESNHNMFSNLSKILEFHRKFLIKLETEYEPIQEGRGSKAWAEGRWGYPFVASEPDFECYGPYCANYLDAIKLVTEQMPNLLRGQELPSGDRPCLHPERELQAFMIKPIQRITKYGLLLDAILHSTAKHDYPYRPELEAGAAAVRRIAANINEVTDLKAKQATVRELLERVEDWKGHEVEKFGDLWLDDHFTVTKADQPRDYHVFLFEKMMLCCKEVVPERKSKSGKNTSMLRKDKSLSKTLPEKRKLALKGRIFVSNINRATLLPIDPAGATGVSKGFELMADPYSVKLVIAWSVPHRQANGYSEDTEDSFIMIGKSEEQMKKWSDKVMELAATERKKQEEARSERARMQGRYSAQSSGMPSSSFVQSHFAPPTPASEHPPYSFPPPMPNQAYGWHGHEDDEDESGFRSGRTTPSMSGSQMTHGSSYGHGYTSTGRRVQSQQAAPTDRPEARARALTEDQNGPSMTQWRSQQSPSDMPLPPPLSRLTSAMSTMSTASEASFGSGSTRPPLGRKMSSTRLDAAEEVDEESSGDQRDSYNRYGSSRGMARVPSGGPGSQPYPPSLRNRSASSPNVYQQPKVTAAPPLPHSANEWSETRPNYGHPMLNTSSSSTLVGGTAYFTKRISSGGKRSSSESHSTETSETSSGQSPATPYSTGPPDNRGVRQNSSDTVASSSSNVLIKLKWSDHQFAINVQADIDYPSLYSKVSKKIRLARGAMPDAIHIRWVDADGDEISLRCDADIEAMFEEVRELGASFVNLVAR